MPRPYARGEDLRRGDPSGRPRSAAACRKRARQLPRPYGGINTQRLLQPASSSPGVSPSAPECPRPIQRNLLKASLSLMPAGDEKEEKPEPAILFVLKVCSWAEPVPEPAAGPGSVLPVRAGELARPRRFGSRLGPPSAAGLFARVLSSRASLDRSLFVLRLCWGPELSALMLLLRMSDNVLDELLMVGNCARAPELQQTRANPAVESAVKARIVFLPLVGMSAA
jgi:hypothetical protein